MRLPHPPRRPLSPHLQVKDYLADPSKFASAAPAAAAGGAPAAKKEEPKKEEPSEEEDMGFSLFD